MLLLCSLVTVSTGSAMAVDYSAVVKSYNPSCYWRLGESSTSEPAVEEIRGRFGDYKLGNTLGLTGAIVGDNNTAVGFTGAVAGDANDSTIIIRDGLDMGTVNELTMICWIKRDGNQINHSQIMMQRPGAGSAATGMTIVNNSQLGYHWLDKDYSYGYVDGPQLPDGAWAFAAISVTSTAATFYVGDMSGNMTTTVNENVHDPVTMTTTFAIGGYADSSSGNGNRCFKGTLDEPAIFPRALTAEEINVIYKAGLNQTVPVTTVTIIPETEVIYAGQATLSGYANGTLPGNWQWNLNGTPIEGATESVLSGVLEAGSYTVTAEGVTSAAFEVLPGKVPTIESDLADCQRYPGGRISFTATMTAGSYPVSWQWSVNGTPIEGATNSSYSVIGLEDSDFGTLSVSATNAEGSSSASAVITKLDLQADSFAEAVMSEHPLAYFRFDDTLDDSFSLLDDQGNYVSGYAMDYAGGNIGYYYGVSSYDQVTGAIKDDLSKAVRFWGSDKCYIGTRLQLNGMAQSGFTTMGWIRRDSSMGEFTTRGGYWGQNDLCEFGDGNNTNQIECWCADNLKITGDHKFVDQVWSLVCLTYNGSTLTLYINGEPIGTANGTLNSAAGTGYYFNIGGGGIFNATGDAFRGEIDEIAFFNYEMTAEKINEFYSKGIYGAGQVPIINTQPESASLYENPDISWTLRASAGGTPPLLYQWYKDGEAIEGATNTTYTASGSAENFGSYYMVVENNFGSAQTQTAIVSERVAAKGSYEEMMISFGPYAYWRLGEKSGKTAQELISNKNGTYNNQTLGEPGALVNDADTAVGFNGTNYMTVNGMDLTTNTMSFVVWVKPNNVNDWVQLLFDRGSSAVGMNFVGGGQLGYHWNDSNTTYDYRSGLYVNVGEWNLVALVVEPGKATLYHGDINGLLRSAENAVNHMDGKLTSSFLIGGHADDSSRIFNGVMDEPAVFARALTSEEIGKLYVAGLAGIDVAPEIKVQPEPQAVFVGDSLQFSVSAIGSDPISYQWYKDGVLLEGATNSIMDLNKTFYVDGGEYYCVISNPYGSVTSETVEIGVTYPPYSIDLSGSEYQLVAHASLKNTLAEKVSGSNMEQLGTVPFLSDGPLGGGITVSTDTNSYAVNCLKFPQNITIGQGPLTVSFWTRLHGATPDLPWFSNRDTLNEVYDDGISLSPSSGANGYYFFMKFDDGVNFSGGSYTSTANVLPAEEWHHLVYVLDPTSETMTIFLDGQKHVTVDCSNIWLDGGDLDTYNSFMVGQDGTAYYMVQGSFDMEDIGVWTTALSDLDARSIYYAGLNGNSFDELLPDEFPPTIEVNPQDISVYQNDLRQVTFTVSATGTYPMDVVWTKDGEVIEDGDKDDFSLSVYCTEDAVGEYVATLTNEYGTASSQPAVLSFVEPVSPYEEIIVSYNPMAYWRFDDNIAEGVAYDYAGAHHGTYVNFVAEQQIEGGIADNEGGKAIHLNGPAVNEGDLESYVKTPLQLNDFVVDGAYSISGWVRRSTSYGDYTTRGGYFGQNDLLEFGDKNNTNEIEAWMPGTGTIGGVHNFADDEWNLIVLTYEFVNGTNTSTLYVNGRVLSQAVNNVPITATAGTAYYFNIGGGGIFNATGDYFRGDIDDVAVLGTALTAEQVFNLYQFGKYGANTAPSITTQPVGVTGIYVNDGTIELSVKADGTPPLTVEWFLNGESTGLFGETIEIVRSEANMGAWTAQISNSVGSVTSEEALVEFYNPTSDYEAYIASLVPWAYWRLGEAAGASTAMDYAGGYHATNGVNNPVFGVEGAIVNDPNMAASFNGAPYGSATFGLIEAPDLGMVNTSEITMLAWVKRNGDQVAYSPIIFNRAGTGSITGLNFMAGNTLGYHWNDNSALWSYSSGLVVEDGVWNLVALTVTPTEAVFYLGNSQGELSSVVNTFTHTTTTLSTVFTIGGLRNGLADRQYKGDIDEPAVFNYALSAEEISTIYELGRGGIIPPIPEGPVLAYSIEGDELVLRWAVSSGAVLEVSSVATGGTWTLAGDPAEIEDGTYIYRQPLTEAAAFYRLVVE